MKKFLGLFLAVLMLVSVVPMSASAETEGIFTYTVTDGEVTITGVSETVTGDIVIPDTIDGYPVTGIGTLLDGVDMIKNVYIGKNISTINNYALYCYALESITVDEENQYFSSDENGVLFDKEKTILIQYPFGSKNEEYVVPSTVKEIGFESMTNIPYLKKLILPYGLETIGRNAIAEYIAIYELTIPDTVTRIESGALFGTHIISEITIPASVEYIGEQGLGGVYCFPHDKIYIEGMDTDLKDSYMGFLASGFVGITREEYREMYKLYLKREENPDSLTDEELEILAEFEEKIADAEVAYDPPITVGTIYCHSGSTAEAYAIENGVGYELTHFFKDWSYDWENYERTAKCIHCDETTTEVLEKAEDTENEVEIIAPAVPDADFVVENIESEYDERYALVVESLESYEGSAEIEKIYDITLQNSENVAVQPDGSVQVKFPVEETHGNYKVFRINDDGTYADMNATVVDGYIVFVTDHFSIYVIVDTSEPHEHLWELTYTAPSCTEDGYELAKCACGDEFIYKTYGALNHNYSYELTLRATHLREGLETYTCSRCGDTYTNVLPRIEKHYYGWHTVTVEPTCTEQGYTIHKCECGDSYTDSYVDALGHTRSDSGVGCKICGVDLEPEKKDCDHICHKGGIQGFFYKIALFFWKIFKTNKICSCGVAHY